MRRFCISCVLALLVLLSTTQRVSAAAGNCGSWSTAPITCLQTITGPNGNPIPATCTLQTTTCPDGTTAYYCGPPTPSQLCQQFGQAPGGGGVGLNAATLDSLNASIFGGTPNADLTTPRGILSRLLPYLMTFGGLILFIMLIWGGFEMLTGAANPKSQEAGKQRINAAIIGFILLFSSYWIAQLVQTIFGISIL